MKALAILTNVLQILVAIVQFVISLQAKEKKNS